MSSYPEPDAPVAAIFFKETPVRFKNELKKGVLAFAAIVACFSPLRVSALPQGGEVVAGSARIEQTSPNRMDVVQTSQNGIINWQSLNIEAGELLKFTQPSASSYTLNRVTGGDVSYIFGGIQANGNLFLINSNGILFGPNAQIDVGGLLATTADISDADFLNNHFVFSTPSPLNNSFIENQGTITISEAGLAAFVAPTVSNSGIIQAKLGKVSLAAGATFTLDLYGDQLIQFEAGSAVQSNSGQNLINQSGQILAEGGTVLLTAATAAGVVNNSINMDGIIEARSASMVNGKIVLSGGESGVVQVSGQLNASGTQPGESGGTIQVLGDQVAVTGESQLNASGYGGGGTVQIGGDFQGKNAAIQNADRVFIGKDAVIQANADTQGDGGRVIVWSDSTTEFYGQVSARAGAESGDGGFAEISGKEQLVYRGRTDLTASNGTRGTLLLDPKNIIIAAGGADVVATNDTFAENAALDATFLPGDIVTALDGSNLVLQANNDITVTDAIDASVNAGNGDLTLQAGRSVAVNAAITLKGALDITVNDATAQAANRVAGEATLSMGAGTLLDTSATHGNMSFSYGNGANGNDQTGAMTLVQLDAGDGQISFETAANDSGVASTEAVSISGTVVAGTLNLNSASSYLFSDNVTLTTLATIADSYSVSFTGAANSITSDTTFLSTGGVVFGDATTDVTTFIGGLDTTAGTTSGQGSVLTTDSQMDIGGLTLSDDLILDSGTAATSVINVGAIDGAGFDLTVDSGSQAAAAIILASADNVGTLTVRDSGSFTISGSLGATVAGAVTITDTTGAVSFAGDSAITTLTTSNNAYSVSFTGAANSITSDTTFLSTGGVVFGDATTDVTTFIGGLDTTAGHTTGQGTVSTTDTQMDIDTLTLSDNLILNSGIADLNLGAVTGAAFDLTLNGGTSGAILLSGILSNVGDLNVNTSGRLRLAANNGGTTDVTATSVILTGGGDLVISDADMTVDTGAAGGNIYLGDENGLFNLYADGLGYQLTLTTAQPVGTGGNILMGLVDDNAGSDQYLHRLILDTSDTRNAPTIDSEVDGANQVTDQGLIYINQNMTVADNGVGTHGQITLSGTVHIMNDWNGVDNLPLTDPLRMEWRANGGNIYFDQIIDQTAGTLELALLADDLVEVGSSVYGNYVDLYDIEVGGKGGRIDIDLGSSTLSGNDETVKFSRNSIQGTSFVTPDVPNGGTFYINGFLVTNGIIESAFDPNASALPKFRLEEKKEEIFVVENTELDEDGTASETGFGTGIEEDFNPSRKK
ncbi:MAG: filamentous hemagglutinin N-terminal domain-containing protein [Magnetococcales bacterium]|nr:filamentous hemagglutinin N-terminal domain-containing protein [Magnetococcales bacterium]